MAAYLRATAAPRRVLDDAADGRCGFVTPPFERGSIALAPVKGATEPLRLVWDADARRRAVPAGEYRVVNYVVEREFKGRTWMVSCSAMDGPTVVVEAGREKRLDLDVRLHLDWSAEKTESGLKLTLALTGHGGMEASLMDAGRDGPDRRVPADFEITARDGRKLGDGTLSYG